MLTEIAETEALTPARHFRLYLYAVVLHLLRHVAESSESWEEVFKQYPFLVGYFREVADNGVDGMALDDAGEVWRRKVTEHESDSHQDRKSTRLNSSHANISYAVFC